MSLPRAYFEAKYAQASDPWGFRSRWYEARKQSLVLACLQARRYASVFEPGCSIGVTTASLAARADHVLAMDVAPQALDSARAALGALAGHVEVVEGRVPADWPEGHFELIVVSEVGYYLDAADCQLLAELASRSADELIVVHWRHRVADYPLDGDLARAIFAAAAADNGLKHALAHIEDDFQIDSWSRDHRSLAEREGLIQ